MSIKMNIIFVNSINSKNSDAEKLRLNLTNRMDLRGGDECGVLSDLSIYYPWRNVKNSYKNNKFKISGTTWDEDFKLPDGSYFIPYIQDYFEYITNNHETLADKPPVQRYINNIQNRVTFKFF